MRHARAGLFIAAFGLLFAQQAGAAATLNENFQEFDEQEETRRPSAPSQVDIERHYNSLKNHPILQVAFRQALSNPALSTILISNLQAAQETKLGYSYDEKVPVLAMAMDSSTRHILVNALMAEKHQRSREIEARLSNPAEGEMVVDVLIIGGTGPAGTQVAMTLHDSGSPLKTLIVEKGETIGGTFDSMMFSLNTSNKPSHDSKTPALRFDNENEIIDGILQVPEIDPSAYPVARSMSSVLRVNLGIAKTPVLFGHQVVDVEEVDGKKSKRSKKREGGPYRVKMIGRNGEVRYVTAHTIIDSSGIGVPNVPTKNPEGQKLIRGEFEKLAKNPGDASAQILNFGAASRRIDAMEYPMAPYAGKTIVVVGDSVASRDFILWLMRYGPRKSYKRSEGQFSRPFRIIWVGHDNYAKSRKDVVTAFLSSKENRIFYSQIAAGLKNKMLVLGGKMHLSNLSREGDLIRVDAFDKDNPEKTKVFMGDSVFLGTGYANESDKIYQNLIDPDDLVDEKGEKTRLTSSQAVEVITAPATKVIAVEGETIEPNDVAIGKKIVGHRIYLLGARAGLVKGTDSSARTVKEGSPLIRDNLPRIREFVVKHIKRLTSHFSSNLLPQEEPHVRNSLMPVGEDEVLRRARPDAIARRAHLITDEVYIATAVEAAIRKTSSIGKIKSVTINAIDNGFEIQTAPHSPKAAKRLAGVLGLDQEFVETLAANTTTQGKSLISKRITVKVGKKGDVKKVTFGGRCTRILDNLL